MPFDPFCKMNRCIITPSFHLLLEVTVHSKIWLDCNYHVYYYYWCYYYLVPFSHYALFNFPKKTRRNGGLQRQQLIFHITFLLSLHLLGATLCLGSRRRSSIYRAWNRGNHCKVNNSGVLEANIAMKYYVSQRKSVSDHNFPWWSLILNISLLTCFIGNSCILLTILV